MKYDSIVDGEAMSASQRVQSITAVLEAVMLLGGPTPFMLALELDRLSFAALISGQAFPDIHTAERIDVMTRGEVSEADLRPDLYPQEDTGAGVDVSHILGRDVGLTDADASRLVSAVVTKLETRAWEAVTSANAEHERHPTMKNKGKVVAAFNRFATLVGAETI